MRPVEKIIIHCSATPAGRNVTAGDIDRWHRQRGFRSIGYHYVILLDGTISRGRPEAEIGAHCRGQNARSIGICYIGGIDPVTKLPADTRTAAQRRSMLELLRDLRRRYPSATIHGHREFAPKDCPCFNANKEYASL